MAYTNLQLLRKELGDELRYAFDNQTGDAETKIFRLSHGRVQNQKVYVNSEVKELTTDYTIDSERGIITFLVAPGDKIVINATYDFSVFSDTELSEFLTLESDIVAGAALRCINILLTNSSRRFDYSSGQTEMKPSQIFQNLKELRGVFKERLSDSSGGALMVDRLNPHYEEEVVASADLSREDFEWD